MSYTAIGRAIVKWSSRPSIAEERRRCVTNLTGRDRAATMRIARSRSSGSDWPEGKERSSTVDWSTTTSDRWSRNFGRCGREGAPTGALAEQPNGSATRLMAVGTGNVASDYRVDCTVKQRLCSEAPSLGVSDQLESVR